MKRYKVITKDKKSICARGIAEVNYSTKKYVLAPKRLTILGYYICVFKDKKSAVAFIIKKCRGCELWEVDTGEEKYTLPLRANHKSLYDGEIEKIHKPWPFGTIMAEQVKLIKKLNNG